MHRIGTNSSCEALRPLRCIALARTARSPFFALSRCSRAALNARACRLLFKDQYIELTTSLPVDAHLYGLGETTLPTGLLLPRDGSTLTMWARDISAAVPRANLYGAHPFFLQVNKGALRGGRFAMADWRLSQAYNRQRGLSVTQTLLWCGCSAWAAVRARVR